MSNNPVSFNHRVYLSYFSVFAFTSAELFSPAHSLALARPKKALYIIRYRSPTKLIRFVLWDTSRGFPRYPPFISKRFSFPSIRLHFLVRMSLYLSTCMCAIKLFDRLPPRLSLNFFLQYDPPNNNYNNNVCIYIYSYLHAREVWRTCPADIK